MHRYVTIGLTKGKTLLPLPPSDASGDDKGAKEKERVHSLESAVVTWTRQIKNVLKTDPENLLKVDISMCYCSRNLNPDCLSPICDFLNSSSLHM